MASETTPRENSCDGIDNGLPRDRVGPLAQDAHNFNQILQANQADAIGTGNDQKVEDASQAFYQELVQLPVGERKALLRLVEEGNKVLSKNDPTMPTIEVNIDADAYLEQFTVKYPLPFNSTSDGKPGENNKAEPRQFIDEEFVYQGWGMCTQAEPPGPYSSVSAPYPGPWLELPPLDLGQLMRRRKR